MYIAVLYFLFFFGSVLSFSNDTVRSLICVAGTYPCAGAHSIGNYECCHSTKESCLDGHCCPIGQILADDGTCCPNCVGKCCRGICGAFGSCKECAPPKSWANGLCCPPNYSWGINGWCCMLGAEVPLQRPPSPNRRATLERRLPVRGCVAP